MYREVTVVRLFQYQKCVCPLLNTSSSGSQTPLGGGAVGNCGSSGGLDVL